MPFFTNNSIAWANMQISGGWARLAWVSGLIAVGLPLMMFGSMRISDEPNSTLTGWFVAMSIAQAILFLIVLPSRVHGAIKRDRTSKLIESHRLMPESSAAAVAGYIIGPNLLLLSCMGVVMILGLFIAQTAQQDPRGWLALHVAAAGLSMMMCCLVAFTAQYLPKFNPALLGLIFGPLTVNVGSLIPAIRVMFAPYTWGFAALQRGDVQVVHVIAFASQLACAIILFIGACRRYRRDDVVPLGFGWGMALVAIWVGLTLIGTRTERVWLIGPFNTDQMIGMAYVIGLSTAMLIAIGPVSSAATAVTRWKDRHAIDPYHIERRPIPLSLATLAVLGLLLTLLASAPAEVGILTGFQSTPQSREWIHFVLTSGVVGVFVLVVALLSHAAGRMKVPPAWLVLPWFGLTWILLPLIDAITAALQGEIESFPRGLSSASPPFCLGLIWKNQIQMAFVGLVAQAATLPMLLALWQGLKRMNSRRNESVEIASI